MVQLPLFQPVTDWTPPRLSDLPSWKGARRVAIDIETCDPDLMKTGIGVRRTGRMIGVSFAIEYPDQPNPLKAPCFYLPFGHEGGDNLDEEKVLQYLRHEAQLFKGDMVTAGGSYDYDYLAESGVIFNPRFFRDIQVAEPLLDENHYSYSLNAVLERNDFEGKNESHLDQAAAMFGVNAKSEMWKLPARHVGPYAEADSSRLLPLIQKQERKIQAIDDADERGARLWDLYNLESRLMPVLVKMRRRGVRIDFDHLDVVEAKTFQEEEASLAEVTRLSGVQVTAKDINRPTVVGKAIETALGIKLPRTKTKKISIKAEVLKGLGDHPVVNHFMRARRFNKLRTTFVESIRRHAIGDRIHCTFHQLRRQKEDGGSAGTITGRLSSGDPNLQQQPARDPEIGTLWRSIYLPDEGAQWACLDYSQQEPRWLVHFAELSNCVGAREAAERYRNDPTTDNHDMMTQMIHGQAAWDAWDKGERKLHRGNAKTIYLGLCYAMGGAKLCRQLGLPTKWITIRGKDLEVAGDEGQALLAMFDGNVPFIKEIGRRAENVGKKRGYIKTVLGRRCRFPLKKDGSGSFDWTHLALNKLIQGSSADQMKKAMVDADDAGIDLQLQVHDELDLSFWNRQEIEHLGEIMLNAVSCNVPHKVDIETGPSWGEIE